VLLLALALFSLFLFLRYSRLSHICITQSVQARCDEWAKMVPLKAKAFFVDRVWDAIVAVDAQEDFAAIKPPDEFETWIDFYDDIIDNQSERILERGFNKTITALKKYDK
jgi:hypothetical protein